MQFGMVFHAADGHREAYVEQVICTLKAGVDRPSFERAWQRLIERHDALRTAFNWTRTEEPIQQVFAAVSCPFVFHDWRSSSEGDTDKALESFLGATCRACSSADGDPAVVDVGRTAPLMEVFVVDSRLRLSPIGIPGEVYLGGELAAEYVNSPKETAERFVPHFFSRAPGARLFRTGDLGRWLPGGNLEILGRRDHQVKIRGYRVELREVEAVLERCSGVKQAAVVVREDEAGDQRIAAYVVKTVGDGVTTSEMRNYLKERLPEYMAPSWIVALPALPLTTNGKLDRSALPAPVASACRTRAYEPPQSELEVMLAAVWTDVLNVDRVGRHDDFFELGGHSLIYHSIARSRRMRFSLQPRCTYAHWDVLFPRERSPRSVHRARAWFVVTRPRREHFSPPCG